MESRGLRFLFHGIGHKKRHFTAMHDGAKGVNSVLGVLSRLLKCRRRTLYPCNKAARWNMEKTKESERWLCTTGRGSSLRFAKEKPRLKAGKSDIYENKGVQWMKSRPTLPPGLNPAELETVKKSESQPMSKSAKKNAKRKEKKKQHQQSAPEGTGPSEVSISQTLARTKLSEDSVKEAQANDKAAIEKKIRNLKKKLKQVDDLKTKIDSGEIKNPEKEQLAKIERRQELVDEIENLELDLED
uniref:Partner of Y14 and mago n=1 Tax=Magallana gigas TaxID=29159 RepID=K1RKX9_MAGGI